jgi:hypothetical protein
MLWGAIALMQKLQAVLSTAGCERAKTPANARAQELGPLRT